MGRDSIFSKLVSFFDLRIFNYNSYSSKKGISPVVATALLLIVAVLAVIGFQNWYGTYSSNLFTGAEIKSAVNSGTPKIDNMIGNVLYIKNPNNYLTIKSVKLDGTDCLIPEQTFTNSLINITIPDSCYYNSTTSTPSIVVVTENQIFEHKVFLKDVNKGSVSAPSGLDCSSIPHGDWILVPGNVALGTSDFCVMKYEAKFVDYVGKTQYSTYNTYRWDTATGNKNITSTPNGGPISNINFTDAWNACKNLGTGYHMITNREWMTIARNAELQNSNWNTGIAGSGSIFRGHSDGAPFKALSVTNINNFYDGTGQSYPSIERRVLNLSNGELIWDLGGNVWEWTDLMENGGVIPNGNACGGGGWYSLYNNDGSIVCSWTNGFAKSGASDPRYEMGPLGNFNANNGMGRIYNSINTDRVLLRGGGWGESLGVGPFAANLNYIPSYSVHFGFRCAYAP